MSISPSNYHVKLPHLTQEEESMEEHREGVAFPPRVMGAAEGQMVRADLVQEIVARRERGESTRQIARELAVDRKTVRALAANRRLATTARRRAAARNRSVHRVHRAARARSGLERSGAASGTGGVGVQRQLSAGAAPVKTAS